MKETPIFEEVFSRILRLPGLWVGVLVGGLLSFIPILNIFAFGYLLRLSRGIRQSGNPALPAWSDWSGLFIDGLKFAVVWLVYWLLPLLIVSVIALIIGMLGLGALAYLLMSVVFLLAPILFSSALYRYSMRSDFKDLLDIALIIRMSYGSFPRLIIPALAFVGIFAVLFPLYGFAVFFGSLAFLTYTTLSFRAIERRRTVAL